MQESARNVLEDFVFDSPTKGLDRNCFPLNKSFKDDLLDFREQSQFKPSV